MTHASPSDMPGQEPAALAPEVQCQKHSCGVFLAQGKIYCQKGHQVDEDGAPITGHKDDLGGDRW
jgi:hypothetical protein